MKIKASSPEDYLSKIPSDRFVQMSELRHVILKNLPAGFTEEISYEMIGYVVPHALYPPGYHCNTKLPLPFINIASQKNFIALYHSGIYAKPELLEWFVREWKLRKLGKLDMGKSCIRFKKPNEIPFDLIGELVSKITVQQWIDIYETAYKK